MSGLSLEEKIRKSIATKKKNVLESKEYFDELEKKLNRFEITYDTDLEDDPILKEKQEKKELEKLKNLTGTLPINFDPKTKPIPPLISIPSTPTTSPTESPILSPVPKKSSLASILSSSNLFICPECGHIFTNKDSEKAFFTGTAYFLRKNGDLFGYSEDRITNFLSNLTPDDMSLINRYLSEDAPRVTVPLNPTEKDKFETIFYNLLRDVRLKGGERYDMFKKWALLLNKKVVGVAFKPPTVKLISPIRKTDKSSLFTIPSKSPRRPPPPNMSNVDDDDDDDDNTKFDIHYKPKLVSARSSTTTESPLINLSSPPSTTASGSTTPGSFSFPEPGPSGSGSSGSGPSGSRGYRDPDKKTILNLLSKPLLLTIKDINDSKDSKTIKLFNTNLLNYLNDPMFTINRAEEILNHCYEIINKLRNGFYTLQITSGLNLECAYNALWQDFNHKDRDLVISKDNIKTVSKTLLNDFSGIKGFNLVNLSIDVVFKIHAELTGAHSILTSFSDLIIITRNGFSGQSDFYAHFKPESQKHKPTVLILEYYSDRYPITNGHYSNVIFNDSSRPIKTSPEIRLLDTVLFYTIETIHRNYEEELDRIKTDIANGRNPNHS
jgi:hypothetical protein